MAVRGTDDHDVPVALDKGARSLTPGASFSADYRLIAEDGHEVWVHDEASVVRAVEGGSKEWHGVMLDITERKLAEGHLRDTERRYRALLEQIPAAVYEWEPGLEPSSRSLRYISPQIGSLLGITPEEWAADPDASFYGRVHPEDRDRVREASREASLGGEPLGLEYRMIAKDGRAVWVRDRAAPVGQDDSGRPVLWQGVLVDITHERRTRG